jgi:hypothetical protein
MDNRNERNFKLERFIPSAKIFKQKVCFYDFLAAAFFADFLAEGFFLATAISEPVSFFSDFALAEFFAAFLAEGFFAAF